MVISYRSVFVSNNLQLTLSVILPLLRVFSLQFLLQLRSGAYFEAVIKSGAQRLTQNRLRLTVLALRFIASRVRALMTNTTQHNTAIHRRFTKS